MSPVYLLCYALAAQVAGGGIFYFVSKPGFAAIRQRRCSIACGVLFFAGCAGGVAVAVIERNFLLAAGEVVAAVLFWAGITRLGKTV